jgi:hypothetical protein
MKAVGRLGQFLGLSIPALAVIMELSGRITSGPMLGMLVFSICCFGIGRILEGYSQA